MLPTDFDRNIGGGVVLAERVGRVERRRFPVSATLVEEVPSVDIREFERSGLLRLASQGYRELVDRSGERPQTVALNFRMDEGKGVIAVFRSGKLSQTIEVQRSPNRAGKLSWSFVWRGRPVLKLYLHNGLLGSRKDHGLLYRTQGETATQRQLRWIDALKDVDPDEQIDPTLGPRARRKMEKLQRKARVAPYFEEILSEVVVRKANAVEAKARARRQDYEDRCADVANELKATGRTLTQLPTEVMETQLAPVLEAAKSRPSRLIKDRRDDKGRPKPKGAHLDISILQRLGHLRKGQMTHLPLAWSDRWLPQSGRLIDAVFDLRAGWRSCAVLFLYEEGSVQTQLFDLVLVKSDFGQTAHRFVDPSSRYVSRWLLYEGGQFQIAKPRAAPKAKNDPDRTHSSGNLSWGSQWSEFMRTGLKGV